jgi:hypothetical protein
MSGLAPSTFGRSLTGGAALHSPLTSTPRRAVPPTMRASTEGHHLDVAPDAERPSATSCYGYEIEGSLRFRYLRPGRGTPLTVDEVDGVDRPTGEPIRRWIPRSDHPFEAELYEEGPLFKLWIKGTGWYEIDPARPAILVPRDADPVRREERTWGFPTALCFIRRGDLPLHAAAVDVGGRALLLAAPGRFGKTTLAGSFLRAGHRLLSEDITCCRLGGQPHVIPGPAMLRVRHDSYERLDFPGTTRVGVDEDRVHLALDEEARGDGSAVPIAAIVILRREDGPTSLEPVSPAAAMQDLWALSFKLPTDSDRTRSFRALADMADRVPIWDLERSLRFDELDDVIDRLISTCLVPS